MSDPFGDDDIDFDTEMMLQNSYRNAVALLKNDHEVCGRVLEGLRNPIELYSENCFKVSSGPRVEAGDFAPTYAVNVPDKEQLNDQLIHFATASAAVNDPNYKRFMTAFQELETLERELDGDDELQQAKRALAGVMVESPSKANAPLATTTGLMLESSNKPGTPPMGSSFHNGTMQQWGVHATAPGVRGNLQPGNQFNRRLSTGFTTIGAGLGAITAPIGAITDGIGITGGEVRVENGWHADPDVANQSAWNPFTKRR